MSNSSCFDWILGVHVCLEPFPTHLIVLSCAILQSAIALIVWLHSMHSTILVALNNQFHCYQTLACCTCSWLQTPILQWKFNWHNWPTHWRNIILQWHLLSGYTLFDGSHEINVCMTNLTKCIYVGIHDFDIHSQTMLILLCSVYQPQFFWELFRVMVQKEQIPHLLFCIDIKSWVKSIKFPSLFAIVTGLNWYKAKMCICVLENHMILIIFLCTSHSDHVIYLSIYCWTSQNQIRVCPWESTLFDAAFNHLCQ